jgi:hypothetical protein
MAALKLFCLVLAFGSIQAELSVTTSIHHGVPKTHESGELIFEDNFDFLDFSKWQHEITMAGGGNWEFQVSICQLAEDARFFSKNINVQLLLKLT